VASAGLYASLHLIPDNHTNIPPLSFLQAGCPSCCPTNSVKTRLCCTKCNGSSTSECLAELQFYVPLNTKQVISEILLPDILG